MKQVVYEITILNWKKHNPNRKKGYEYTLVKNTFCNDAELQTLPLSFHWLYLNFILHAGSINQDTFRITSGCIQDMLRSRLGVHLAVNALQSLQLVTAKKIDVLNKIREDNKKEAAASKKETQNHQKPDPQQQKKLVEKVPEKSLKAFQQNELQNISRIQDLVAIIPEETRKSWKDLYDGNEPFVRRQLIRCWQYYAIDKPEKRPTKINDWSRVINAWLEQEWSKQKTTNGTTNVRPR